LIVRRYIIGEILKPAVTIISLLIAIFASYMAVTYLADAVVGVLSPKSVLILIALKVGMALEVLLPITFFLSVIIALGRLYKDSEMTALSACGVGLTDVLKAVVLVAIPVAVLAGVASIVIRPAAYETIYRLRDQAKAEFDISRLEADRFMEFDLATGKYAFFAESIDQKNHTAVDVFFRVKQKGEWQVIKAQEMHQADSGSNAQKVFVFRNGTMLEYASDGTGGQVTRFAEALYPVQDPNQSDRYRRKAATSLYLFRSDLLEDIAEFQWRLSTPLSTMLLALLGIPLSRTNPRKGEYAKLGLAVVYFAVYYQLFVIAKTQVEKGGVPPLIGIWWVPALLSLVVLTLLIRTGEVFNRR
jgi:lipopolysaccharide export system permease protein